MTDNTQELDQILDRIEELSLLVAAENSATGSNAYGSPSAAVNRVKQAIIDWHNKQTEELLDRLIEQQWSFGEKDDALAVPTRYLMAERNKL